MAGNMICGIGESKIASTSADENSEAGDFECNICFDLAQDPIVTLCGHLYCWPCLYQWLQVHSYSHECPVCKALIEQDKLVPVYGRGKASSDPRPQIPGVNVPNRPVGQRPPTAPPVDINYFRQDELDHVSSASFRNLMLSALLGILPAVFSLQAHGIHDATVYGATTGVPYLFSSSLHGGYAHGIHYHSTRIEGKRYFTKILCFLVGFYVLVHLIFLR